MELADDIVAANGNAAAIGAGESGEDADQRGLAAGAVRAEQAEELAILHREAYAFERLKILVALLDVSDFYG